MLCSAVVRFRALTPVDPHGAGGSALRGLLLRIVERASPALGATLHHDHVWPLPYTVSPMLTGDWPPHVVTRAAPNSEFVARFTALGQATYSALERGFSELVRTGEELHLGHGRARPLALLKDRFEHPLALRLEGSDLLRAPLARRIRLHFLTPLAFRRSGRDRPFAEPESVIATLLSKWKSYVDPRCADGDHLPSLVQCVDHHLEVRYLLTGRFSGPGVVGFADYALDRRASDAQVRLFNGLFRLTFFTGLGRGTTMGMGQAFPEPIVPIRSPSRALLIAARGYSARSS